MVAEPKWNDSVAITPLVESTHWLTRVGIYLDRALVDLRHGLQLNVVPPYTVLPLPIHVLFNRLLLLLDKVFEEVLVRQDVVHALLSNQ